MAEDLNVHANQIRAGRAIVEYYDAGIDRVILIAQMQSGKTGTAKYVTHLLIAQGIPAREIYFICGMNDNDLLNQARREFKSLLPVENILFSKQLQTWPGGVVRCVITDESHYASNRHSQIDQFMQKIKTRYLSLSVSATPMAELAGSIGESVGRVILEPGPGYYGIKDIFANGYLQESVDITHCPEKLVEIIAKECHAQWDNVELKYNIIRLPNQWYTRDLEDEIRPLFPDIRFINHHMSNKGAEEDFNTYLKAPPSATTIIWIYGSLRAGKQLNTENIGFVHDTFRSGPDTIAQSLLGRIMGYQKERHGVTCYTDISAATLMLNWVKKGFDPYYIPHSSRAILNGYQGKAVNCIYHPPLAVVLDGRLVDYYRELKLKHGNRYPYREELITDIQLSATTDRLKIEQIFQSYSPGLCGGLMILTEYNVARSYRENFTLNYNKFTEGCPVGNFLTVSGATSHYYIYMDLHRHSDTYGTILIIYKETSTHDAVCPAEHIRLKPKSRFLLSPV